MKLGVLDSIMVVLNRNIMCIIYFDKCIVIVNVNLQMQHANAFQFKTQHKPHTNI